MRDQRRRQRMLRAGAEPGHEQRGHQRGDAAAETGEAIAEAGKRGAEREHDRRPEPLGQQARWNLKTGERAREHRLHQPERGKAEAEFVLPDRQHDVDQVGIAVVQRMRAAGHAKRTPLLGFAVRAIGRCGHGVSRRRSTKVMLTSEITGSPFWLTPVERNVISPAWGRLSDRRVSITSLLYAMVSPT